MVELTNVAQLVINKLSQEQYDELLANNLINDNELYITHDGEKNKLSSYENDVGYITNEALIDYPTNAQVSESLETKQNVLTSDNAGTGITIENNIIQTTAYEQGDNIIFEPIGSIMGDVNKYYDWYTGDLYEDENLNKVIFKDLGIPQKYLRTRYNFGNGLDISNFTNIDGNLTSFNVRFKLTSLPIIDETFSSFLGGAFGNLPKTNIKVSYNVTNDVLTFTQEYYGESLDECIINNTYTIQNAQEKLLNKWATFSLYKEDSVWKINVDNLGELTTGVNNNETLGITGWNYIFICNSYSTNNNQTDESGYFVYDVDLLNTGIYENDNLSLNFYTIGGSNTYRISATADFPSQTDNAGKALVTDGNNASWEYTSIIKNISNSSETGLSQLVINKVTQEEYNELLANNQLNENELYITDNNESSDIDTSSFVQNLATDTSSLVIMGVDGGKTKATSIGYNTQANDYSTALGAHSKATGLGATALGRTSEATKTNSIAIGVNAKVSAPGAIALGAQAVNTEEKTFKVSLSTNSDKIPAVDESTGLYTMLTSDGKIPNERLNILPNQENNVGKALVTDGENTEWKYTSVVKSNGEETGLSQLVINNVTQAEYDELVATGQVKPDEIYLTEDVDTLTSTDVLKDANGYIVLNSGIIIQWGVTTAGSGNVTYSLPFTSNSSYSITTTSIRSSDGTNWKGQVSSRTSTGCTIISDSTSRWMWTAIGY